MSVVISVITQKGGVGKTTTVNSLAATLNKVGKRVLTIDIDPQSNLSFSTGADVNASTIYDVLKGSAKAQDAIQRRPMTDIIPSTILLSGIELEFTGQNREFLLKKAIKPIKNLYDYILIDSPPGLGILTVNALAACDYVLIPMLPDIFSLQGLALIYETIEHISKSCNPSIKFAGIVLNRYSKRSLLHREVYGTAKMISEHLDIPIFNSIIRNCVALSEAQSLQCDITDYSGINTGAKDFKDLVNELFARGIC
jgi:chromosome partitioning protein